MHQISSQYGKLKSKGVVTQESEQTPSEQCAKISVTHGVLSQVYKRLNKAMAEIEKLNANLKSVEVPIRVETGVEELQKMGEIYGALQKGCVKIATVQSEIKEHWNNNGERG